MRLFLCIWTLLGSFLLLGAPSAQGQLIKARNLLEQGELLEAKPFADEAVKKKKNAEKARAWYFRGKIHYKLFRSPKEDHREYVKENGAKVSRIAVRSYLKALEFDEKGKFQKEIEKELPVLKSALLNYGYKAFKRRDYVGAYRAFDLGVRAGEALSEKGRAENPQAYFNAGLAARQLGKNEKALEYFRASIEMGNQAAKSYFIISRIHKEAGDLKKGFEVVQEGRRKHPGYRKLVLEELDYFLRMEEYEEARKSLETALKKNPENAPLHFSLGSVYDQLYQKSDTNRARMGGKDSSLFQKAAQQYKRALEIDSSFYRAYYNLGALYYNRGADVRNAAMTLKGQAKYEDELAAAKKDLKEAKPYLKRALEIKPNDPNTLNALRKVYAELGNKEKAKELEKRLNN